MYIYSYIFNQLIKIYYITYYLNNKDYYTNLAIKIYFYKS